MFSKNTSPSFKRQYFISSLLPSYIFTLLLTYTQFVEKNLKFIPEFTLTLNKISYFMVLGLFIFSFISLMLVRVKIKIEKQHGSTYKKIGKLDSQYNAGVKEFLIGIILPTVTTVVSEDGPISSIISLLLIQGILMYFYYNSNEIWANIPLIFLGYYVMEGYWEGRRLIFLVPKEMVEQYSDIIPL